MAVPSPATPKGVGLSMLEALGYPLRRDRSAHIIWQLVKAQFAERQVLFLHLDEAQDFSRHNNRNDQHAVVSTLKSLMQSPQWPVGLGVIASTEARHPRTRQSMSLVAPEEVERFFDRYLPLGLMAYALGTQAKHVAVRLDDAEVWPLQLPERCSKIYLRREAAPIIAI